MIKKLITVILILLLGLVVAITAQEKRINKSHSTMQGLICSACHECDKPSSENTCLKLGPEYFFGEGEKLNDKNNPPETVIINRIEEKYNAVKFPHRKHIHMAEKTGECAECHHYTPPGRAKNPPCSECHDPMEIREDLNQVGLLGAYHRKCLTCHVEWSKTTVCEVCHEPKDEKIVQRSAEKIPEFREVKEPEKKVYAARYTHGPIVTFFHKYHSDKQKLACADCHVKQPCVVCHYQGEEMPASFDVTVRHGVHGTCSLCHETLGKDVCTKCHLKEEQTKVYGKRR